MESFDTQESKSSLFHMPIDPTLVLAWPIPSQWQNPVPSSIL